MMHMQVKQHLAIGQIVPFDDLVACKGVGSLAVKTHWINNYVLILHFKQLLTISKQELY